MTKTQKRIIITFLVMTLIILIAFKLQNKILKNVFPIEYQEYVYKYSEQYNIDPLIIFSIIKAESNFNPIVVSKSEAIGLMQLLEPTAQEIANKTNYITITKEKLFEPELNIMLGTKYFSDLLKLYEGNTLLALTAYNAGQGNVKNWIEKGIIKPDGTDIENIPFKETNNYVRKILRNYRMYKQIYISKQT